MHFSLNFDGVMEGNRVPSSRSGTGFVCVGGAMAYWAGSQVSKQTLIREVQGDRSMQAHHTQVGAGINSSCVVPGAIVVHVALVSSFVQRSMHIFHKDIRINFELNACQELNENAGTTNYCCYYCDPILY